MSPYTFKSVLTLLVTATLAMSSAHLAFADDDDDDHERGKDDWFESRQAPVVNAIYSEECGSCHMAYQPGLLPPQAWARIMTPDALIDHYGDDASLSEELRAEISAFLAANATNVSQQMIPGNASNPSMASGGLPRITASFEFKDEHDEIPARLVTGNPEVNSFSQCNACHQKAAEGNYDERWIDIPGHGPWRD
ncbi:cytochrome c [Thiorhodovibrio frisius]|uniref:Dihem cytochrome c n=1 Tax=Thiorhodovibrio frisius TaxID=631362 RepID=H8Z5P8_9GAMM|nr:cytochrome c [Thiorhodovibrio frisius]EIC19532.1 Dihem cytochrome c [Thiorhodovibrio frisius]WPL20505.1 Diheme cytochrome c [Thiorhodovibrio frisius]